MAFGLAAPGRRPGHRRAALAGRLPRPDPRDRRPGARRHHADERQHERAADRRRAPVRGLDGDAGGARERHDRHPHARRRRLSAAALAPVSHRDRRADPAGAGGVDLGLYSITPANDAEIDVVRARGLPRVPARGASRRACATSSRCSRPTSPGARAGGPGAVPRRLRRAHARRRPARRAAAVPEDALPRAAGDARRSRPTTRT